jgi:predicted ester cyclase
LLSATKGADFIALMRRYVVDYTNRHDQAVTGTIMEPDYLLVMGDHEVRGRDTSYHAATRKQFDQFPGLCLTVNEIRTSGERLVMRFTEHGASRLHDDKACAWSGLGLYRWNGARLVSNAVEQDYFSRREQLRVGVAQPVLPPDIAPWDQPSEAPDPEAEEIVRKWLDSGQLAATSGVLLDDQATGAEPMQLLEQEGIEINDLFSCGPNVAFHIVQHGRLRGVAGFEGNQGRKVYLHAAGLVRVEDGRVCSGHVVTNRLDLQRRLDGRLQSADEP